MTTFKVPSVKLAICTAFLITFFKLNLVIAELDHEDVCHLYLKTNFSDDPILSLRPSIKVFETPLIFQLPKASKGISIQSLKISRSNCSVILCDGKALKGNCTEILETKDDLRNSSGSISKNVLSVDCHCSESLAEENLKETILPQEDSALTLSASDKVKKIDGQPCATLFREWHYKGGQVSLPFPGSVGAIGRDSFSARSATVRNGCKLVMWGNSDMGQGTFSLSDSNSFLNFNDSGTYDWACCHCDTCSETVCKTAKSSTHLTPKELKDTGDFSNFVQHGKKIIGIGRNYRWKKVELAKVLSVPTEPIVFLKPTTSYIQEGDLIELPSSLGTIFYELELGVVIGKRGSHIPEADALDHVAGYFLALDMTAKEFIKGKGNQSRPWELGKGFDSACPVGQFIPKQFIPDPNDVRLECTVNGEVTQSASTSEMIFNVKQLISYVSKYMTLEPYDTLLTGTPDGFGPLGSGDVIEGRMGNLTSISFTAVSTV